MKTGDSALVLWKRESDEEIHTPVTKGQIISFVVFISLITVGVFICWAK